MLYLRRKTKKMPFSVVGFEMKIKSIFCFHSFNFCFWKEQDNKTTIMYNSIAIHCLIVLLLKPSHQFTWYFVILVAFNSCYLAFWYECNDFSIVCNGFAWIYCTYHPNKHYLTVRRIFEVTAADYEHMKNTDRNDTEIFRKPAKCRDSCGREHISFRECSELLGKDAAGRQHATLLSQNIR